MIRRKFLKTVAASPAVLAAVPRRPDILYIHSHDTGRYMQPYGHAVPTPNLQRLAEQGVLFRRAFSAAPCVIVENLTNLDSIPAGEFHLTVLPLCITGRDGAPARAVATLTGKDPTSECL